MKPIVILTGAGISAESGLATFRAADGLWCGHRVEDVATPEAYERDPELVHHFYNERRRQLKQVRPNAAHEALERLANHYPARVTIITQNVDDLHDRAGSSGGLLHMHGELLKARCEVSEQVFAWQEDLETKTLCSCCRKPGRLRPHIVWFGEMPFYMDLIESLLSQCGTFVSIGTSGNVYPAAGFVRIAKMHGAHTLELNLEPSLGKNLFDEHRYGKASEIVPAYVEELLASLK
ncbi:MAG: NAD-dependent protein deacylase [Rickettsiales bacterium]|jgi:NAD-dependent deacetylase|nr:NAD-dependent protein deacylase [Rickettsiales bacterium]